MERVMARMETREKGAAVGVSRRQWLRITSGATLGVAAGGLLAGCEEVTFAPLEDPEDGHLVSRPGTPVFDAALGVQELGIGTARDGHRFIPSTYRAGEALPLLVVLHGAGGGSYGGMQPFLGLAESARFVLVSPDSRGVTWDRTYGSFGPDSRFIDNALSDTFLRCDIDRQRIGILGFSDGASYALSLGRTNGDFFSKIVAFSPGFMSPNVERGKPDVFVSHGVNDSILEIDRTSRRLVPRLRNNGYDVTYEEFDGAHQIPSPISAQAFAWLTTGWGL